MSRSCLTRSTSSYFSFLATISLNLGRAIKTSLLQNRFMFHESIINLNSKFKMWKLQQICSEYAHYLAQKQSNQSQVLLFDFKIVISNFCRGELRTNQKNKLMQVHSNFLLQKLAQFPFSENINFTVLLQLINFIFRSNPLIKITFPSLFITSLTTYLQNHSHLLSSQTVVTNAIWLICKFVQGSFDRQVALRILIDSKLLQVCINGGVLEQTSQRGISLLMGYMCKRQILNRQIYLTLLSNLTKFNSVQCIEELLVMLSKQQSLTILRQNQEKLFQVKCFFQHFLIKEKIQQKFIKVNWKIAILVASISPTLVQTLRIREIITTLIRLKSLNIEKGLLFSVINILKRMAMNQAQLKHFLSLSFKNFLKNALSRRIFIQFHEQVNAEEFVEILSNQMSSIQFLLMSQIIQQRNNALKLIICLRRIANRLGLNSFYDFKIGVYHNQIFENQQMHPLNKELLDLLNMVTEGEQILKN